MLVPSWNLTLLYGRLSVVIVFLSTNLEEVMQDVFPLQKRSPFVIEPNFDILSVLPELTKPNPFTVNFVPPRLEISLGEMSITKAS